MRRAIIFGASSGIGQSLARLLVADGYKVGIAARRVSLLEELKSEDPENYIVFPIDLTETGKIKEGLESLTEKLGGVDLLILSSGAGEINENLEFLTEKMTIDVNVTGFTAVTGWAYRYFENQQRGHLVAITSIAGLRGSRAAPAYNATKAYQVNYLEGLRQKAKHSRLQMTITDIRPGLVNTAMAKGEGVFWIQPVDKVARQIYKAICRKKSVGYVTRRWTFIALLFRLLPRWIYNRM